MTTTRRGYFRYLTEDAVTELIVPTPADYQLPTI